jgi:hypothetical protein
MARTWSSLIYGETKLALSEIALRFIELICWQLCSRTFPSYKRSDTVNTRHCQRGGIVTILMWLLSCMPRYLFLSVAQETIKFRTLPQILYPLVVKHMALIENNIISFPNWESQIILSTRRYSNHQFEKMKKNSFSTTAAGCITSAVPALSSDLKAEHVQEHLLVPHTGAPVELQHRLPFHQRITIHTHHTNYISGLTLAFPLLPHIYRHDTHTDQYQNGNHFRHDTKDDFGGHRGGEARVCDEVVADAVDKTD